MATIFGLKAGDIWQLFGSTFASLALSSLNKTDLVKLNTLPETKAKNGNNLGNPCNRFFLSYLCRQVAEKETFQEGPTMISQHI